MYLWYSSFKFRIREAQCLVLPTRKKNLLIIFQDLRRSIDNLRRYSKILPKIVHPLPRSSKMIFLDLRRLSIGVRLGKETGGEERKSFTKWRHSHCNARISAQKIVNRLKIKNEIVVHLQKVHWKELKRLDLTNENKKKWVIIVENLKFYPFDNIWIIGENLV